MKQLLQNLRDGTTEICSVPAPQVEPGRVLIRTRRSLISTGTERMLVEFARANLIGKARQQPEKVRQVIDKVRTDGLSTTVSAIRNQLDRPLPLGYCNAGVVVEVGSGVSDFSPGDRVASNGNHAEIVSVPSNLCARIPERVSDESAAFTVIAAIALQGIRLAAPTLGETVAVFGLGIVGLITVQLLRAQGCNVLGLDFDADRLAMAQSFGAKTVDLSIGVDPAQAGLTMTGGNGIDAAIITATTKSSEPIHQAALMCRKRGRIVLVGVTGLELSRSDFYEKELTFQVSCSYGPGRYDPRYEGKGLDYPIGYVRWTEQRNFEAILAMMSEKRLNPDPLISHRVGIEDAEKAYSIISGSDYSLGVLLTYPNPAQIVDADLLDRNIAIGSPITRRATGARVAFIGAGNCTAGVLIRVVWL